MLRKNVKPYFSDKDSNSTKIMLAEEEMKAFERIDYKQINSSMEDKLTKFFNRFYKITWYTKLAIDHA